MRDLARVMFVAIGVVIWLSAAPDPAAGQGLSLVWSDEFNYTGVPDPAKWDYEVGYIRNNEKQYYTNARVENASVAGGVLTIMGRKETYAYPGGTADYTSASLITQGKESWQYGRLEMRAKLPQGLGVWPAFWMLGTNFPGVAWPYCGEIDIMEFIGREPAKVWGTVHWGNSGGHTSEGSTNTVSQPWNDFHIYAVEWDANQMDFYFDQTKYFSYDLSHADYNGANAFRMPQYLILNLALGGDWSGTLDDSILPQPYVVDYVRVYQTPEPASMSLLVLGALGLLVRRRRS